MWVLWVGRHHPLLGGGPGGPQAKASAEDKSRGTLYEVPTACPAQGPAHRPQQELCGQQAGCPQGLRETRITTPQPLGVPRAGHRLLLSWCYHTKWRRVGTHLRPGALMHWGAARAAVKAPMTPLTWGLYSFMAGGGGQSGFQG